MDIDSLNNVIEEMCKVSIGLASEGGNKEQESIVSKKIQQEFDTIEEKLGKLEDALKMAGILIKEENLIKNEE